MTVRVPVAPGVLDWVLDVASADADVLRMKYKVDEWAEGIRQPTLRQLQQFAASAGVGFGYLLLPEPPVWKLPIPDFREGFSSAPRPSANLIAVISQSQLRQDWFRDYAMSLGATPLDFVGSAATLTPLEAAAAIRSVLAFEVSQRHGSWFDTRKILLQRFEAIGGLTVATSMVGNNTKRPLDENEFRGFALVDPIVPLVFVNTHQTINGQIFTLAHEFAHVWRGTSGIGNENLRDAGQSDVERWCNEAASEVLVPRDDLAREYAEVENAADSEVLDELAKRFRCGTLVVLQALHRTGIQRFDDFGRAYEMEVDRLRALDAGAIRSGGSHYANQPYRIGERLSRAVIADTLEGRTSLDEALRLLSMKSVNVFDEYAKRLGVA